MVYKSQVVRDVALARFRGLQHVDAGVAEQRHDRAEHARLVARDDAHARDGVVARLELDLGEVDRVGQIIIVLGVWLFQIPFSLWWLERFRFGPFEWLWRSLSYLRFQPMRRQGEWEN